MERYRDRAARVRAFGERVLAPTIEEEFRAARPNPAAIPAMAAEGLLGWSLPPRYGGLGHDYRALAVLCEELGRIDAAHQITVTVHLALVGLSILQWGSEAQRQRWLPLLARGERIATFALTEPGAGSDVGALIASARRGGPGYVLNGEKSWISLADEATLFLVFASVDRARRHHGITAFLVERGTPGLSTTTYPGKLGIRAGSTGSVIMQDVRVGPDALLGQEGEGFAVAMAALGNGLYTVGAGAVGAAQAALDATVAFLHTIDPSGTGPARSQWVQQRVARMVSGVERSRLLIHRAGALKNRGVPNARETGLAKWQATEAAFQACQDALAIRAAFGPPPYDPIERILANAKGSVIFGGTSQIHTGMQAGYALGYRPERAPRCPAPTATDLAAS
ncbi:MAG: acyl-CoA dehydrogenase family protein [Sphaerobacter sp.]|nr:acyl-CoA dehydrogenase family protein [Sphaerobacter sp.]